MLSLHASYLLETVKNQLNELEGLASPEAALNFELITNSNPGKKPEVLDPVFAIYSNIVSRGQFTLPSQYIEDQLNFIIGASILEQGNANLAISQLLRGESPSHDHSSKFLQYIAVPTAIARLHKTLLEYILSGKISLEEKNWTIGIVEQDLPCAHLAIEDFKLSLADLFLLEGKQRQLPNIELFVLSKEESALHLSKKVYNNQKQIKKNRFDLLIDIANLGNNNSFLIYDELKTTFQAKIKPSSKIGEKTIYQAAAIDYSHLEHTSATQAALRRVSRNIFREEPTKGQYTLLLEALSGRSLVGRLPQSLTGRTIGLLAYLQAAASLLIEPGQLSLHGLASYFTKKSIAFKILDGKSEISNTAVLNLLDYSLFYKEAFRGALRRTSLRFGSAFLDEAQHLSLWGHQFLPGYLPLVKLLKTNCISNRQSKIPVIALTSTASLAALREIRAQLGSQSSALVLLPFPKHKLAVEIVKKQLDKPAQIVAANPRDPELALKKSIALDKQETLVSLIDELRQQKKQRFIVFCLFANGYYGVAEPLEEEPQHTNKSVLGKLCASFPDLTAAGISKDAPTISVLDDWASGKIDILVAQQSCIPGIDLDQADHILYLSPPCNIEALHQNTIAQKTIPGSIIFSELPFIKQGKTKRTIEQDHLHYFHRHQFKGREKEQWILKEILEQVSFPSSLSEDNELTQLILKETSMQVRLNLIAQRLYISELDATRNLGYLDLSTEAMSGVPLLKEQQQIERIFSIIKTFINKNRGVNYSPLLIEKYFRPAPVPGLMSNLQELNIGEKGELEIAFVNNTVHKIQDIIRNLFEGESVIYSIEIVLQNLSTLKISLEEDIFQKSIWAACQDSFTPAFFIKRVNEYYKQFLSQRDERKKVFYRDYNVEIKLPADQNARERIEGLLLQMRTKNDTFKALHSLYNLGIVEDFSLDAAKKKCLVCFERKAVGDYKNALRQILKLHLSDNEVTRMMAPFDAPIPKDVSEPAQEIKLAFGIYLDYIYKYIAPKRLLETNKILAACKRDGSPLNPLCDLHFESRYGHPLHLPNLPDDLDEAGHRNLDTVWKYMKLVGEERQDFSFVSNMFQLEIVVNKLLKQQAKQATLLLLKAFTYIYKYTAVDNRQNLVILNETKLKEGTRAMVDGFIDLKTNKHLDSKEFNHHINTFCSHLTSYRKELEGLLVPVTDWLYVEAHNRWLKAFNQMLT